VGDIAPRRAVAGGASGPGRAARLAGAATGFVDIVFSGTPGPEAPRFVDVEDEWGRSIRGRTRRRCVGVTRPPLVEVLRGDGDRRFRMKPETSPSAGEVSVKGL
jgi:hypothetical protein